jgi:hypothetical protein
LEKPSEFTATGVAGRFRRFWGKAVGETAAVRAAFQRSSALLQHGERFFLFLTTDLAIQVT